MWNLEHSCDPGSGLYQHHVSFLSLNFHSFCLYQSAFLNFVLMLDAMSLSPWTLSVSPLFSSLSYKCPRQTLQVYHWLKYIFWYTLLFHLKGCTQYYGKKYSLFMLGLNVICIFWILLKMLAPGGGSRIPNPVDVVVIDEVSAGSP